MSFNPKKCTEKVNQALGESVALAQEEQHQQLQPIHLAVVLFEVSPRVLC